MLHDSFPLDLSSLRHFRLNGGTPFFLHFLQLSTLGQQQSTKSPMHMQWHIEVILFLEHSYVAIEAITFPKLPAKWAEKLGRLLDFCQMRIAGYTAHTPWRFGVSITSDIKEVGIFMHAC